MAEIGLYLKAHFPNKLKPTYVKIVASCRQFVDYPKMGRVGRVRESREYVMPDLPYVIISKSTVPASPFSAFTTRPDDHSNTNLLAVAFSVPTPPLCGVELLNFVPDPKT